MSQGERKSVSATGPTHAELAQFINEVSSSDESDHMEVAAQTASSSPMHATKDSKSDDFEEDFAAWLDDDLASIENDIAAQRTTAITSNQTATTLHKTSVSKQVLSAPCEDCGAMTRKLCAYAVFKLHVCHACRREQADKYKLISKSRAKDTYLITDSQLNMLPYLSKANPSKPTWGNMSLYLESAVKAKALEKYTDMEAIAAEKLRRGVARVERAVVRERQKISRATDGVSYGVQRKKRKKGSRKAIKVPDAPPPHKHDMVDDKTRCVETCSTCGIEVPYEEW